MSKRKYKVSFYIDGSHIEDDYNLTIGNIRESIINTLTPKTSYHGIRSSDTKITNLKVSKIK